ncbi:hypothetical protein IT570_12895 [Candidatus Sumerlaeota bacterium]|nr:hypothetical protein [Candidatus Sumerlaeota bacterium]
MKFLRFLPVLLAAALTLAGCGESKEEKQIKELSQDQKALVQNIGKDLNDLKNAAADMKAANDSAMTGVRQAQDNIIASNGKITELTNRIKGLQEQLNLKDQQIKDAEAKKAAEGGAWKTGRFILILIVVLIIIFLIIRMMRSRSEFDEENDDFSDFGDDDDLGFEDDEVLEEDNTPKKDDDDKS